MIEYTPKLFVSQIQDVYIRKNFELLDEYFRSENQLLNFKFFEVNLDKATSKFTLAHGLNSKPLDIITTHFSGAATSVTFRYDLFDDTNIVLDTVGGACTVRFLAGTNISSPGQGASSSLLPQAIHA